jgi:hypothetical protein
MTMLSGPIQRILTVISIAIAATSLGCSSQHRDISPKADDALRKMSRTLADARAFTVHTTATMDQRLDSGQMAQFTRDTIIVLSRPDGLFAQAKRDKDLYRFWHTGKEVTILDVRRDLYATVETPAPVDDMLDCLAEKYDVVIPMADLLYSDPYKVLVEDVEVGTYVDKQQIGDNTCHHLLFTQENVDWQIWIETGEKAVPRKVVITYKNDPGEPQYEAVLDDWHYAKPEDLARLKPDIPSSAKRVDINQLFGSDE